MAIQFEEQNSPCRCRPFRSRYSDLLSTEPGPPPFGIPITFANGVAGDTYGVEFDDLPPGRNGGTCVVDIPCSRSTSMSNPAISISGSKPALTAATPIWQAQLKSIPLTLPHHIAPSGSVLRYVESCRIPTCRAISGSICGSPTSRPSVGSSRWSSPGSLSTTAIWTDPGFTGSDRHQAQFLWRRDPALVDHAMLPGHLHGAQPSGIRQVSMQAEPACPADGHGVPQALFPARIQAEAASKSPGRGGVPLQLLPLRRVAESDRLPGTGSAYIVIGVIGEDPFGTALDDIGPR